MWVIRAWLVSSWSRKAWAKLAWAWRMIRTLNLKQVHMEKKPGCRFHFGDEMIFLNHDNDKHQSSSRTDIVSRRLIIWLPRWSTAIADIYIQLATRGLRARPPPVSFLSFLLPCSFCRVPHTIGANALSYSKPETSSWNLNLCCLSNPRILVSSKSYSVFLEGRYEGNPVIGLRYIRLINHRI